MTGNEGRTTCMLPGGHVTDGVLHREAELIPLSGREEELLTGPSAAPPTTLVTEVLCRCVKRIGSIRPVAPEVARRLLIADRQYLLLKLREITFGDRIEGTLACPWPDCGAKVDIDFSTQDIPVKRSEKVAPFYRVELSPEAAPEGSNSERHPVVTFRLPNGEDQEVIGPELDRDPARALTHLFERCLQQADTGGHHGGHSIEQLSSQARLEIERAMEAHAPHLELDMDLTCPECGRAFTAPFDLQDFFFGELSSRRDLLYRQVHYLAYHYHWSEQEILAMPREKRLDYIEILAEEIEALNDAR